MSCVEKVKENIKDCKCPNETMIVIESVAICFDELIAELNLSRRDLNERLDNVGVQLENLQNITVYKG
jgi:hypothetical protein